MWSDGLKKDCSRWKKNKKEKREEKKKCVIVVGKYNG
jgi:hypothetical protein